MGPPRERDGVNPSALRQPRERASFNGAAARTRRSGKRYTTSSRVFSFTVASMGPPRERDGVGRRRRLATCLPRASMGPPRERDGVQPRRNPANYDRQGFNGAAARTRRSELYESVREAVMELQWGRRANATE